MSYNIELSPKADRELGETWEWYEDAQSGLGDQFNKEFLKKIN